MNQISPKTYRVKGMHCASCASIIEKTLKKAPGVHSADANFGTETAKISFNESKTTAHDLSKKLEPLGYSLDTSAEEMGMTAEEHAAHTGIGQSKQEKLAEIADMKTKMLSVIPLAIISIFIMGWDIFAQFSIVPGMSHTVSEFFITYSQFLQPMHYL
jgi:Cu2+-exporting ATPase/Cu+-exporting ATPase